VSAAAAGGTPTAGAQARASWRWLGVAGLVVVLDQLTKLIVIREFDLYDRLPVLPFFDLVRLHNTGAAFSLLAGASGWQNWFFTGVAVVVCGVLLWWFRQVPPGRVLVPLALMLVVGGAIGNLIDRLAYGYVVDFVLLYWREWSYPAFNVADSAITVGVVLLLYDGLVLERRREVSASSAP
jgi:signal peptidase II